MPRCHRDIMSNAGYRDKLLARQLASHEFDDDVLGKPLNIPPMNFTIPLEKKVQAISGPPYYAMRARRIEQMTGQLVEELTVEYRKMVVKYGDRPPVFARKWEKFINGLPLDKLNDLIEKHNEYFPIEADLKIDIKTGAPMFGSALWEPKEKVTIESLLQQIPLPDRAT